MGSVNVMQPGMRNSCFAPEIIPIDSTPQPYTEYSGPQIVIDKSQKELALGDAQLEKGVEEGKEAYNVEGLEHRDDARSSQLSGEKSRRSVDEWYERFRELAKKNVGWVLLVLIIVVITVVIKGVSGDRQMKIPGPEGGNSRGTRYNGTVSVSKIGSKYHWYAWEP